MQKHILLFGAGKSASVLIDYLKQVCEQENWQATIVDFDKKVVEEKVGNHILVKAQQLNISNEVEARNNLIAHADIVVSLLPPNLHYTIALDCLRLHKNLLTASYVDEQIQKHSQEIYKNGLLFLYEMGLDPGIDHLSAMQLIDNLKSKGAEITSFKSHCGGLVAPESNNNPWGYKISWNPKNVVMAGSAGALYQEKGSMVKLQNAHEVFKIEHSLSVNHHEEYGFYPNRDSLSYMETYGLQNINTFIRTTLRHKGFIEGWFAVLQLKLTDTSLVYDTTNLSLANFFKQHFASQQMHHWQQWIQQLPKLQQEQLLFLGLYDEETLINKGNCNAADVLQFIMEKKWMLQPHDKDMVVMVHEIEYTYKHQKNKTISYLKALGESNTRTAMAKTVGLPLGIAATLILKGHLKDVGLQIPTKPIYYNAILPILEQHQIYFVESKAKMG